MRAEAKRSLIEALEKSGKRAKKRLLRKYGIPSSTYYRWRKAYEEDGILGLERQEAKQRESWNVLIDFEKQKVIEIAMNHPELSSRLLAVKICDEEDFSISESTVYRVLKHSGLIAPRPLEEMPAKKEWRHKTHEPDEIWQSDGTVFFIVGWGYYKLINVLDDYSRNMLAWELFPDETGGSISMAMEKALEEAKRYGHLLDGRKPTLLTDNGSGFKSEVLAGYLAMKGIRHIFGRPYHPQTQGKIERFHGRLKREVCLMVYCSPEELKKAIDEAVMRYRITPHKGLKNVSPENVYLGKQSEILARRKAKKELTLIRRKLHNQRKKTEAI